MSLLLDIFAPYMLFISFLVTMIVNIYLISKGLSWYLLIVGNLILALVMNFFGLGNYDILTQIVTYIGDLIKQIFISIFSGLKLW